MLATSMAWSGPSTRTMAPPLRSVASMSSRRDDSARSRSTAAATSAARASDQVTRSGGAVGAVLGLGHEVDGDEVGGGRFVGHHHQLRRAGGGLDADHAGHLPLGQRDVDVARSDDDVDRPDGLGAVGHGGDGLGAADPVHLVDGQEGGGGQRGLGDGAVGAGRHAQGDLGHAGHLGRDGGHQHGGRVHRPPAGDVATGPVDRPDEVADDDALPLVARLVLHLGAVVGHDLVAGELERLPEPRRHGGQGVGEVTRGHPEVLQLAAVEAGGEVPQGVVAPLADVGDDLPDRFQGPVATRFGARQGRGEVVAGTAAKVESCEHR